MREQIAPARRLIAQSIAERIGIDTDQQQIVLAGKMPSGGFMHLFLR